MSALPITITPAGIAALINSDHTGSKAVQISQVGLSAQTVDPASIDKALPAEIKRLTTFGGKRVGPDTLHLSISDPSGDTYTVRSFALYLDDGTLFAVYSQAETIIEKSAQSTLLLVTDIRLSTTLPTQMQFGNVEFVNPPATENSVGVMRFATQEEHLAGDSATSAATPKGIRATLDARLASKVAKTGDTMSGPLVINAKEQAVPLDLSFQTGRLMFASYDSGEGMKNSIQSVNFDNTDRTDLLITGKSIFINPVYGFIKTLAPFVINEGPGIVKFSADQGSNALFSANLADNEVHDFKIIAKNIVLSPNNGGSVISPGGFAFGSSLKLKKIHGENPYGLAEIEQLNTYVGRYKTDYNPDERQRLFLDAEQLMDIIPEAVNPTGFQFSGDDVPTIQLDQLVPVLVKAIGDLAKRVRQLEQQIESF